VALVAALTLLMPATAALAGAGGGAGAPNAHRGATTHDERKTTGRASKEPDLASARARLAALQARIATQQGSVGALVAQISEVSTRLSAQQAAYDTTQSQLAQARDRLAAAQSDYDALRIRLDQRAVQALRLNSGPQMEFLLESHSFAEVSDRLQFLNQIQVADAQLAAEVQSKAHDLQAQQDELEAALHHQADLVSGLDSRQAQLAPMLADEQHQLKLMSRARKAATALVAKLERQRSKGSGPKLSDSQLRSVGGEVAPYGLWAKAFLQEIEAAPCHDNLVVMVAWQVAEGTQAAWNPLATTLSMPGSTSFNSVGVQNYASFQDGLQAIHQTLENGSSTYGYGAVLASLRGCAGAMATAQAINASSWCRGCASGAYVTGLVPVVETYFDRYAGNSAG
jgi:peptidoglycan hydrolase CwlO-like protein